MSAMLRAAVAVLLATAPVAVSAPAGAVRPPPVDRTLAPPPGPASPTVPTRQDGSCVSPPPATAPHLVARPDLHTVWARTRGAGQIVAVIDTGVARHRLLPRLAPGGDYVSTGDGTADCDGHGTIVAGIIGAAPDPASGFSGIAPEAGILAIRQSSMMFRAVDTTGGGGVGDVETLAAAVRSAADQGATVINIASVACLDASAGLDDRVLGAALSYAVDVRNAVVIAAAGNVGGHGTCPAQNPDTGATPDWEQVRVVVSPSWYDDLVLTVGSVTAEGRPSDFTLAGPWVDVAAAGEAVVSLSPSGEGLIDAMPGTEGLQPISGTSYATPVVSGIVALLRAVAPQLTARQVMQRIESTARRPAAGWDPLIGHGVVDVVAAVAGLGEPAPPTARRAGAPPPTASGDTHVRVALIGAAVCAGLAVAVLLTPRSRRSDGIPDDSGSGDGQFGAAR